MTPDDRATAGELALGLLDGEERAEALRLVLSDRDFALEVEWWRDRFAGWFAQWPEVMPDAGLEERIIAALPGSASSGPGVPSFRRAANRWRGVAGAATLAAAGLLAALVLQPERTLPPRPSAQAAIGPAPLLAVLTPTDDAKPLAASVDRRTGVITLVGTITLPADRVAELWTIAADGVPRSLGLLGAGAPRLAVAPGARARLSPTVVLAISIEPRGGSTTGAPTGPVIVTGPLTTI
ncbi:anti-sigma factor domain-containing protein [uncultured Sphingomonas sp.]|uniref:anti-sigma factor n=1 Tax=uncultured Sphingomonas sp. TaxID=158754 RepID=UPI0035C98D47